MFVFRASAIRGRFKQISFNELFKGFSSNLDKLKATPEGVLNVLLESDDPYIARLLADKQKATQNGHQSSPFVGDTLETHHKHFRAHNICWGSATVSGDTANSPWYRALPNREKDVIRFVQNFLPAAAATEVSQGINRAGQLVEHNGIIVAPTVLPKSCMFVFGRRQRPITGLEALVGAGFPRRLLTDVLAEETSFSDSFLMDLAGNAFSGWVLMPMFVSMLAAIPWSRVDTEQGQLDRSVLNEAMFCLVKSMTEAEP